MQTVQSNQPFYRNVHIGTAAEKTALTSPGVLDIFIETDTDKQYFFAGTNWVQVTSLGISIGI